MFLHIFCTGPVSAPAHLQGRVAAACQQGAHHAGLVGLQPVLPCPHAAGCGRGEVRAYNKAGNSRGATALHSCQAGAGWPWQAPASGCPWPTGISPVQPGSSCSGPLACKLTSVHERDVGAGGGRWDHIWEDPALQVPQRGGRVQWGTCLLPPGLVCDQSGEALRVQRGRAVCPVGVGMRGGGNGVRQAGGYHPWVQLRRAPELRAVPTAAAACPHWTTPACRPCQQCIAQLASGAWPAPCQPAHLRVVHFFKEVHRAWLRPPHVATHPHIQRRLRRVGQRCMLGGRASCKARAAGRACTGCDRAALRETQRL